MALIMIVDDEEDIRESTKRLLLTRGFQVSLAKDVDDCLKKIKKSEPDLILLDLMMPGTPVEEFFKKVKKIKIILFSVITPSEKDAIKSGKKIEKYASYENVADYVNKPFDNDELIEKINRILSG